MKRSIIAIFIAAALAASAAAQARLDLGIDVPKGIGAALGSGTAMDADAQAALAKTLFPFPEASLHYQFELGPLRLGAGIRAFTLIVASVAWPNAFAELDLGPLVVEAQVGGGVFAYYALVAGDVTAGKVFFPDLSAWLAVGKKRVLRLGCGAMGLFLPGQPENALPFVLYFGGKAAIEL